MNDATDPPDYKRLLEFLMHELWRVREIIDNRATQISVAAKGITLDEARIRANVLPLMETVYVFHMCLAIVGFCLDPDLFMREQKNRLSLHEVFFKAQANLKQRARHKRVTIRMDGEGKFAILGRPIVGIVPYLLLDNAIKYSPAGGEILVELFEGFGKVRVQVTSLGPTVDSDEMGCIFDAGFRSRAAKKLTTEGNGQGLAILHAICTAHGARVTATSDPKSYLLDDIAHSSFCVCIEFAAA